MKKIVSIVVVILFAQFATAQVTVKLGAMFNVGVLETIDHNELHTIPMDPVPVAPGVGIFYKGGHAHLNYELNSHSVQALLVKSFKSGIEVYGFFSHGVQASGKEYGSEGIDYTILVHKNLAIVPYAEVGTNLKAKYMFVPGCTMYIKFDVLKR